MGIVQFGETMTGSKQLNMFSTGGLKVMFPATRDFLC